MSFLHRVRTIYRKELIDILRDRRTLIAMILVPIVLYPLLLLGSVQAVSHQAESLGEETLVVAVVNERSRNILEYLIAKDTDALNRAKRNQADEEPTEEKSAPRNQKRRAIDRTVQGSFSGEIDQSATPLTNCRIEVLESEEKVAYAVRERAVHVGIIFQSDFRFDSLEHRNEVKLLADLEEVRSRFAHIRIVDLLQRTELRIKEERKAAKHLPTTFDQPFKLDIEDLSSPPSILGQVLPLILVLMTITGAIYPAIDLTAGERERGTLESLMVCPVPVFDLIVGKFLVVTTVAIMGATLNLASVSATVYFGGFNQVISISGGGIPFFQMALILLCLIPFAVLMSAIMIAVCAYARTFKEAQNYVTPVIIAVLLPGGIAAMPATRLDGVMLVMPVGNMVLLARELLIGANVSAWHVGMVLLSTTLYAAAAVGIAARVFGAEAVVFSDAGSFKNIFSRRLIHPQSRPNPSMALSVVAILFPVWFFMQTAISPGEHEDFTKQLRGTAVLMPLMFVVLPTLVLLYWKVNIVETFSLRKPCARYILAAVFIGLASWIPVHELIVLQDSFLPIPQVMAEKLAESNKAIQSLNPWMAIGVLALLPAICEELIFRGLLLNGLRDAAKRRTAIIVSAAVFGVFHFMLVKFVPTTLLGLVLGYLCWQSRSIVPGMIVHLLHNGLLTASLFWPWQETLGVPADDTMVHLPSHIIVGGLALVGLGLWLAGRESKQSDGPVGGYLTAETI